MSIWEKLFSKSIDDEYYDEDVDKISESYILDKRNTDIRNVLSSIKEEDFQNKYEYYLNLAITMISEMEDRIDAYKYRDTIINTVIHKYNKRVPAYLLDKYQDVLRYMNPSYHQPFRAIYEFAKFLIVADALLFYNNDDTADVRSIPETSDSIKLLFVTDDFNIGYYFTRDITKNQMKSLLEEYVDGNDAKSTMIGYVEVKRNHGSETKTNFTFDIDNGIQLDSTRDQILFDSIINNTIQMIIRTYNSILDRAIPVYTGDNVEDFNFLSYLEGFTYIP